MPRFFLFIFLTISLTLSSCGKDEGNVDDAIDNANLLLTQKNCSGALAALNKVGYQNQNSRYLQTYASAYACLSGFSEITFFGSDVDKITAGNTTFLPSLATFTTSATTSSTDASYTNLKTAINTLLYAGGLTASSQANRAGIFGTDDASNMSIQAMYMILAQLGKYVYLHGNTNTSGQKGARDTPETNDCFTDYTTAVAQAAVTGAGANIAPCSNADYNDGHSELKNGAANRKEYLCEGAYLFNNFFDILTNVSFGSTSNSGSIGSLSDNLSDLCDTAGLGAVCTIKDQDTCESDITIQDLELYFIAVYEVMVTGP